MEFQLADLYECLCDARANRVAHHLAQEGIGRGDHVGVYAYNRAEWVETLLACWKIGAATVNVNFRYVADELRYLWDNSDMVALVYERGFAEHVFALAGEFPALRSYLVLEDGSGADGPGIHYEEALSARAPERGFDARSGDDVYLVYTGGTTGMPKGVLWRHEDLYSNIARPLAGGIERPEEIVEQADNPFSMRTLTLSPLMHGGCQYPLFITILNGGVGLFPTSHRFDAHEVLAIVEGEKVTSLCIIGDAMGRPLAEAMLEAPSSYDTSSLVAISTGGALLTDPVRALLRKAFGEVFITGGIGSSEIGSPARETRAFDPNSGPRFALDGPAAVLDDDLRRIEPGSGGVGRLARTGHIPLGYYKDPAKTADTFVTDAQGVRWVLPGDYARVENDGSITLLGRGSQCINSGGEKIFADEVEAVIARHPAVRHAVVIGVDDPTWQQRVVELRSQAETLTFAALHDHCRLHLAGYKLPRDLVVCDIERTPSGKVDYPWAKVFAERAVARDT